MNQPHVVKLGGSLLDLPDLRQRVAGFVSPIARPLIVVGGGEAAELVRAFDTRFEIGPERGHWLAVRAMQFNAQLIAAILCDADLAGSEEAAQALWSERCTAVADPFAWLECDEAAGRVVPHHWQFTSDSIAAHFAHQLSARLTLLKSTEPAPGWTLASLAAAGIVDEAFPEAAAGLAVEVVNLRRGGE